MNKYFHSLLVSRKPDIGNVNITEYKQAEGGSVYVMGVSYDNELDKYTGSLCWAHNFWTAQWFQVLLGKAK